eukprot:NODE_5037_length_730_cov_51.907131_g5014_i0.p2 GENE.NODE_5037_length_730_cov_51.907131_g5014_i0~~NODE_5037_length_730_cov_51.907131_g5014_i0.p2  ORF type:complete len:185 (-),score=80.47 NODE_5037_length_730_cov_51.907131_g5014_i0:97-651(-)
MDMPSQQEIQQIEQTEEFKAFKALSFEEKLQQLTRMFEGDIITPLRDENAQIEKEERELEEEKAKARDPDAKPEDVVKLDIGGRYFNIKRKFLCRVDGKLKKIFSGDFVVKVAEKTGATLINRDYTFFEIIAEYLEERPYKHMFPTEPLDQRRFLNELKYYELTELEKEFTEFKEKQQKAPEKE